MRTITIESFDEFAARHGGSPVEVRNQFIFADGATCRSEYGDARAEPPADPASLLALQREYHRATAERAEATFYDARSRFSEQASLAARYSNLPSAPEDAPEILNNLKQAVHRERAELARIESELAKTPQARRRQERQELDNQRVTEITTLHQKINSVVLDD